jgi:sortase A
VNRKLIIKIFAVVSGLAGVGILLWVFFPIISYQLTSPSLVTFLSPIPDGYSFNSNSSNQNNVDYTKASSWFPTAKLPTNSTKPSVSIYKISIPRLGIKNAIVSIGGEDLAESLIQYPGTAIPGQIGNAVIFGHSVLPSFYNPADYLTIFSTLPTLGQGDAITVSYDGITYKYQVEDKFEVEPTDIQILNQDESDSFLSLVTCVPPGLTTRREIIKARIVPLRST